MEQFKENPEKNLALEETSNKLEDLNMGEKSDPSMARFNNPAQSLALRVGKSKTGKFLGLALAGLLGVVGLEEFWLKPWADAEHQKSVAFQETQKRKAVESKKDEKERAEVKTESKDKYKDAFANFIAEAIAEPLAEILVKPVAILADALPKILESTAKSEAKDKEREITTPIKPESDFRSRH